MTRIPPAAVHEHRPRGCVRRQKNDPKNVASQPNVSSHNTICSSHSSSSFALHAARKPARARARRSLVRQIRPCGPHLRLLLLLLLLQPPQPHVRRSRAEPEAAGRWRVHMPRQHLPRHTKRLWRFRGLCARLLSARRCVVFTAPPQPLVTAPCAAIPRFPAPAAPSRT